MNRPSICYLVNEAGDNVEIRTGDIEAFWAGEPDEEPAPEPEPDEPDKLTPSSSSTPSGGSGSSSAPSQRPAQPTYSAAADPASYDVSAASITVRITNTSQAEGGYGYAYRIERSVNDKWEAIPLDFDVQAIAAILPAGQSKTEMFSLWQEQYDYQPGKYRIVFLDGLGGAAAGFTLE